MTTLGQDEVFRRLLFLLDDYRDRCLWFMREDFTPRNRSEAIRLLGYIERYGDRKGFMEARELKTWLLRHSKAKFAG